MTFLIATAIGYLLGSIPFGLLLTRAAGIDIRKIGSGNIGATNVLRTGNRWMAAATLLLDAGKGAAAVLVARYFLAGEVASTAADMIVYGAGVGAFFGHVFPVWLGFKGGKGVATYIGVLLGLNWIAGLVFCGVWLLIAVTRRFSSLAALTAAAMAPLFAYGLAASEQSALYLAAACALMTIVLYVKHWPNIRRLIDGTEPKIGADGPRAT
ncbi:glycerol-3-phosphate 1-O-acyltransferase PlsY [Devosia sp.]|uniref:glycerol-3-phosphate 1-O-acyltransferase PlsY n=1 Tax=Devosia sp. TaxID=1871048 RepID=UPI0035AEAF84